MVNLIDVMLRDGGQEPLIIHLVSGGAVARNNGELILIFLLWIIIIITSRLFAYFNIINWTFVETRRASHNIAAIKQEFFKH